MWTLLTINSFNWSESCLLVVLARYLSSSLYSHSKVPKKLSKFDQKCCQDIIVIMQIFIVVVLYMSHAKTQTLEFDQFTHLFDKFSILVNFSVRQNLCSVPPPDKIVREHMSPKQCVYTVKSRSAAAGELEKRTYAHHLFSPSFPLLLNPCLSWRVQTFHVTYLYLLAVTEVSH